MKLGAITETQYTNLRSYEHGQPSWREKPPRATLVVRGLLVYVGDGFFQITPDGLAALAAFREKYKLPAGI